MSPSRLRMKTDGAPEQLGWSITDGTGAVVASALPGSENLEPTTEYVWDVTLPELGCYTLTLMDEGGDGLFNLATSMDGVGFLEVNSTDGETILDQDWFYQELDAFSEVTFDLEVTQVTSVDELGVLSNVALFPNPASSWVTLAYGSTKAGKAQLVIRNVTGQEVIHRDLGVMSAGNHRHILDVGFLDAGTYLVELRVADTIHSMILLHP